MTEEELDEMEARVWRDALLSNELARTVGPYGYPDTCQFDDLA